MAELSRRDSRPGSPIFGHSIDAWVFGSQRWIAIAVSEHVDSSTPLISGRADIGLCRFLLPRRSHDRPLGPLQSHGRAERPEAAKAILAWPSDEHLRACHRSRDNAVQHLIDRADDYACDPTAGLVDLFLDPSDKGIIVFQGALADIDGIAAEDHDLPRSVSSVAASLRVVSRLSPKKKGGSPAKIDWRETDVRVGTHANRPNSSVTHRCGAFPGGRSTH